MQGRRVGWNQPVSELCLHRARRHRARIQLIRIVCLPGFGLAVAGGGQDGGGGAGWAPGLVSPFAAP